jgi:hypothetical protein
MEITMRPIPNLKSMIVSNTMKNPTALAPAFMSKRDIQNRLTVRKGMLYYRIHGYSLKAQDIVWILCMGKYPAKLNWNSSTETHSISIRII